MIRREVRDSTGQECWVLIMQPDHARVSGCLAEAWGREPYEPLAPHAEMVSAIDRHDDGWFTWEQAPKVDSAGQPLGFMEMPLADSLEIWRRSIASAATVGYLAGHMVSRHFDVLLRRFSARWQQGSAEDRALAEAFLKEQSQQQAAWLAKWQSQQEGRPAGQQAEQALGWLQFFDTLSLWLCCAERTEPEQFQPPQGPPLTITPRDGQTLQVTPWPLVTPQLTLEVPGRQLPAGNYRDAAALADAAWQPVEVTWRLVAGDH